MSTNSKIERAKNGPGPVEIVLSVLLSLALGVLLAAVHLVFKPVEIVKKAEDAKEVGVVYFVEGEVNSNKSRQWTRKRQMLADGGPAEVAFSEEELNAWISTAAPAAAPAPGAAAAPASVLTPERINFRIRDGVFQAGVVGKLSLFGLEHALVVQTRGDFQPGGDGFAYVAKELYVGSLPVHAVPGLAEVAIRRALASQEVPEDIQATWKKLKLVAVEGNVVKLALP